MISIAYIQELSDQEARRAAREKREPYVLFDAAEIDRLPPFPFPELGSHVPRGWRLVERVFCDSTGFGYEHEPALTIEAFKRKLRVLEARAEAEGRTLGYAIVEHGQFQHYVGVFERTQKGGKRTRRN